MAQQSYPLWVSHTSMRDYISCPRAYFLRHVYKDPLTGNKINIINPALALGNTVHDVLEVLSDYKVEDRFAKSLEEEYEKAWERVTGDLGGFRNKDEEELYKERGLLMIKRVIKNPGPLNNLALKLRSPDTLPPRYLISTDDNILLCGKIDWLEYFPEDNSVHIIDFKTGVHQEDADSLQLPIYTLLVKNCQKRNIKKISYWYLEKDDVPVEMAMPDIERAHERVIKLALEIKKVRLERKYDCKRNGCYACKPLEMIVKKQAKFIKTSGYQDIYTIVKS
jgi:ATP-dependent helicase/DNAse subunit B